MFQGQTFQQSFQAGGQSRDRSSDFKNVTPERMQKAEDDRRKYLERNNGVDKHNLAGDIYNFMARMPGDVGHMTSGMPKLNFVQHGDNNNAEASMRIGQVAPTPTFKQEINYQDRQYGQVAPPQQFEYDGPRQSMGYNLRNAQMTQPPSIDEQMNSPQYQSLLNRYQVSRGQDKDALGQLEEYQSRFAAQPPQQLGGMFNEPQQRGGMFNQQNQFNPQGMQQMMQFMQQMMQMFSMMGGQNRGGGFGGGFGGQQQYQQPQRYQPQPRQQYQPPPRQQFQPVQQQYGQMGPQQPSPFAQSIRPRY